MRRRATLTLTFVMFVGAVAFGRPADAVTPIPEPPCSGGGCFDIANAMSIARHLSVDIGPRRVYDQRAITARDYLSEAMSTFGLNVSLQQFPLPAGGSFWNVIGKPAPDTMEAGKYGLVGGHYDTVNGSPGANDNATGTAAVIDIARAIAAQPASMPVVLVAFGAEEAQPGASSGRVGSKYFVNQLTSTQRSNLVAFVNLDYVGYGSGTKIRLRHISGTPGEATNRLQGLAASLGVASEVQNIDSSDDAPFAKAGLNAGSLRGMDDPNYHTQYDTYSRLKTPEFALAGRLAVAAIRSYTASSTTPPPSTATWTRVQQNTTAATYSGTWATYSDSNASGGSYRRSNTTNSSVKFVFNGTGVRWIGIMSPNGGIAELTLDGVVVGTIDQYASAVSYQRKQFERIELVAGQHTLVISVTGQRNSRATDQRTYIDAFEFFP